MKYEVTLVNEVVYHGEVEANSKEEAYNKVYQDIAYYPLEDFLEIRDENINVYLF